MTYTLFTAKFYKIGGTHSWADVLEYVRAMPGLYYIYDENGHENVLYTPPCERFAMCANYADTTRDHPVHGIVAFCNPCDEKIGRAGSLTSYGQRANVRPVRRENSSSWMFS